MTLDEAFATMEAAFPREDRWTFGLGRKLAETAEPESVPLHQRQWYRASAGRMWCGQWQWCVGSGDTPAEAIADCLAERERVFSTADVLP